ncbi:MAG TPA: DinB family protein [Cryptosporangiaceae bacterium]|nr:DinB family protein [Cryptosporangiaceae bacterium]
MTWTAPQITRVKEPYVADERTMLEGWLDYHRQTLLLKCAGLTAEQLKLRAVPPSTLSLLGLVRHMAEVERGWFRHWVAGAEVDDIYSTEDDEDADFEDIADADAEADLATFRTEVELSREAAAGRSLEDTFVGRRGDEMSVRWVFVHMIEEYARHNGHADLLRECIDGATGD